MKKKADKRVKKKEKRERKKQRQELRDNEIGKLIPLSGIAFIDTRKMESERDYVYNILDYAIDMLDNKDRNYDTRTLSRILINIAVSKDPYIENDEDNNNILDICKPKNKNNKTLNETEKNLIINLCNGVLMDYSMNSVDIDSMRLFFEVGKEALSMELEDKTINYIDIYYGYKSRLEKIDIKYNDIKAPKIKNNYLPLLMFPKPSDKLYNETEIARQKYKCFSETSLVKLANAVIAEQDYNKRCEGKELNSYSIITFLYTSVLELELNRCIKKYHNEYKYNNLTLKKCIDIIYNSNLIEIINEEMLLDIDDIRKIRNKTAHGEDVSKEDFDKVKLKLTECPNILGNINFVLDSSNDK